jgi:tRNA(Ser,Leu) C12 N-acetylase TAN1
MTEDAGREIANLIVTNAGHEPARATQFALKTSIPIARVRKTGFKGIFSLEAAADVVELAKLVYRECRQHIGHVTAVVEEVESRIEPIKGAAVRVGQNQIDKEESFCFRIHKRGAHYLEQDTLTLEQEIGSAIWIALEERHGARPRVRLKDPDIVIVAEVLGPITAVGISRRSWRDQVGVG